MYNINETFKNSKGGGKDYVLLKPWSHSNKMISYLLQAVLKVIAGIDITIPAWAAIASPVLGAIFHLSCRVIPIHQSHDIADFNARFRYCGDTQIPKIFLVCWDKSHLVLEC